MEYWKLCVTTPAVLCAAATLILAFVPFAYFWQGRDPDLISSYIYCTMTYQIEERMFIGMILLFWFTFMYFTWQNFSGDVRKRVIVAGSINAYLHYMLGRTYYRDELHTPFLLALLLSTVAIFVLSRRWNWFLLFAFAAPGIFAFLLLSVYGGSKGEDGKVSRNVLWVYAISTHWPSLVFVFWLFVAPCMKERMARMDVLDKAFQLKSKKKDLIL
jgi:hypothetical protein